MQKNLLTLSGLVEKFGRSRSTVWRMTQAEDFPKPIVHPLFKQNVWREADVDGWVDGLTTKGDAA